MMIEELLKDSLWNHLVKEQFYITITLYSNGTSCWSLCNFSWFQFSQQQAPKFCCKQNSWDIPGGGFEMEIDCTLNYFDCIH
jgi:hypothetical protein